MWRVNRFKGRGLITRALKMTAKQAQQKQDLNFYWKQVLSLKKGERTGNTRGVVFHCGDYMFLEAKEGAKKTSCLDAAQFLAGLKSFGEVAVLEI